MSATVSMPPAIAIAPRAMAQKKRGTGRAREGNVFSLVNDAKSTSEPSAAVRSNVATMDPLMKAARAALQGESRVICLQVPKALFDRLFNGAGGSMNHGGILPFDMGGAGGNAHAGGVGGGIGGASGVVGAGVSGGAGGGIGGGATIAPEEFLYTRLSIPELHPEIPLVVEPEEIVFVDYQKVDNTLINQYFDQQNIQKKMSLILPSFESGWPEGSSYCCWNCTEPFKGSPVGIPTPHDIGTRREFHLEGNFCRPSCAGRYLFDHYNGNDLRVRWDLLNLIYRQKDEKTVTLAPPPLTLKKFGGALTVAQYREAENERREYNIYRFPLKPCLYLLEETRPVARRSKEYVALDPTKVKNVEAKYRLYRKAPLPSKSNNIEKCLGITYRDEKN